MAHRERASFAVGTRDRSTKSKFSKTVGTGKRKRVTEQSTGLGRSSSSAGMVGGLKQLPGKKFLKRVKRKKKSGLLQQGLKTVLGQ